MVDRVGSVRGALLGGAVVGVVACGPDVHDLDRPVDPAPLEGVVSLPRFAGTSNVTIEVRGQHAASEPCDVDGDGLDDIVLLANHNEAPLRVLHGREELLERSVAIDDIATSVPLDGEARVQCLGDLDGDSAEEVVLCGHLGDRTACRIVRLAGDGSAIDVALALDLGPVAYPFFPTARVIDLDGDGKLDLFVDVPLWDDPVRFFVADVAAQLDAHEVPLGADAIPHGVDGLSVERITTEGFINEVHFADLDDDGAVERLAVFCHGPDGNCAPSDLLVGAHAPDAEDLVLPVPRAHVWEGVGPYVFAVGDLDGDGVDDILFRADESPMLAFGPVDYTRPLAEQAIALAESGEPVLVGDIDGDGTLDSAVPRGLQDGAGVRVEMLALGREPTQFAEFAIHTQVSVSPGGDFDGDGDDELVVWDEGGLRLVYGHPRG